MLVEWTGSPCTLQEDTKGFEGYETETGTVVVEALVYPSTPGHPGWFQVGRKDSNRVQPAKRLFWVQHVLLGEVDEVSKGTAQNRPKKNKQATHSSSDRSPQCLVHIEEEGWKDVKLEHDNKEKLGYVRTETPEEPTEEEEEEEGEEEEEQAQEEVQEGEYLAAVVTPPRKPRSP